MVLINRDVLYTINKEKEKERNKNRKVANEKKKGKKKKNISSFLPIYDATFGGQLAKSKSNSK